jgi:hypothetical protein
MDGRALPLMLTVSLLKCCVGALRVRYSSTVEKLQDYCYSNVAR